jgi:hypothetical protein
MTKEGARFAAAMVLAIFAFMAWSAVFAPCNLKVFEHTDRCVHQQAR